MKKATWIALWALMTGIISVFFITLYLSHMATVFHKGYTENMQEVWKYRELYSANYNPKNPNQYLDKYEESLEKTLDFLYEYSGESKKYARNDFAAPLVDSLYHQIYQLRDRIHQNDHLEINEYLDQGRWYQVTATMLEIKVVTDSPHSTDEIYTPWWATVWYPIMILVWAGITLAMITSSAAYLLATRDKRLRGIYAFIGIPKNAAVKTRKKWVKCLKKWGGKP